MANPTDIIEQLEIIAGRNHTFEDLLKIIEKNEDSQAFRNSLVQALGIMKDDIENLAKEVKFLAELQK